ncbi:MAG: type II toxin-antitoxin system VapC family toxin [Flavobacteriales bacterium]|nr:MAG: type II toxin-antitoxin system VapC family toxin [Flavobacteriales bacterium]
MIDTNIVLYLLNGDTHLADMLTDKELTLSNISRMELLSFPDITKGELAKVEVFLEAWPVVEINSLIEEQAIAIRRKHRLKLPDSIIAATAMHLDIPLVTGDTSMLKLLDELDVIHYQFRRI